MLEDLLDWETILKAKRIRVKGRKEWNDNAILK